MADNTGSAKPREATKADSRHPKPDIHQRFEITAGNNGICGEIWISKDTAVAASDTFTLTVVAP
jgi:hypothetical protein